MMTLIISKDEVIEIPVPRREIRRVAVIGSGVMGAGIAAHCANAGCDVVLMDIVPKNAESPNQLANNAISLMKRANPEVLMHPDYINRIHPANLENDLHLLEDRDWIIEVVIENLQIKQDVYQKIADYLSPQAILSSNTSTIPRSDLVQGMDGDLASRFMITHFFNPPRYLPLLEVITSDEVDKDIVARFEIFADERLGKRVTYCNDTPGFIGNRLGIYFVQRAIAATIEYGFSVEQADAMLGRPIGLPKTAVFGLMDLVGIDLIPHVVQSMVDHLPKEDMLHAIAGIGSEFIQQMISEGYTGRKGKGGFYRLNIDNGGRVKEARNLSTGEYTTANRHAAFTSAKVAKQGLLRLLQHGDAGSNFVRDILLDTFVYAAKLVPVVSTDISAIDGAMKVGYNWKKGPFEMMDSIGIEAVVSLLNENGRQVPELIILAANEGGFYSTIKGELTRLTPEGVVIIERPLETMTVADIKRLQIEPLQRNASASIWDAGDGILLLEYHSKLNAMDPNSMNMILSIVDLAESDKQWRGIVIANDSNNFCAGANLGLALFAANLGAWKELEGFIALGQEAYQALKYSKVPIVAAAAGMCLGGGCEILLHVDAVQAYSESYIGLVEVGVGIIPGWGGCKELLARLPSFGLSGNGPMAPVMKAFENIGTAKVSKSAAQAKDLGYLRPEDGITMNRDRLLADAKNKVIELAEKGYSPPIPHTYNLPGLSGRLALKMALDDLGVSGKATPHDLVVVGELARVLSGGDEADITATLTEEDILKLEREAIYSLARDESTLARMEHMLANGKPLRN